MKTKTDILLCFFLGLFFSATAQNFTGQWKGEFIDKSTSFTGWGGDRCEYVLEVECKGNTVSGSSYTYFSDGGKKYYTICKLEGFVNKKQKYIEVKEVERTKTNVPINIRNCFQVHKLTYFKHGDSTLLEGSWIPAPGQDGDCGLGTTLLSRRELKASFPKFNNKQFKDAGSLASVKSKGTMLTKARPVIKKPLTKTPPPLAVKKASPGVAPVRNAKPVVKKNPVVNPAIAKTEKSLTQTAPVIETSPEIIEAPEKLNAPPVKFGLRNTTLLKTIAVENSTVKVDLYDNGEVDGDSISLFYNGKLLLSSKRLSEKPISLNITVDDDDMNELVMYAENLGTIPPNTALMVVTDGAKRYEVRITSDLQKSGVINFVHKK